MGRLRGVSLATLPAGAAHDPPAQHDLVHAVDGDGASVCEALPSDLLLEVDHYFWHHSNDGRRCLKCVVTIGGEWAPVPALPLDSGPRGDFSVPELGRSEELGLSDDQ
jgi:hypothetical protein